MIRRVPNLMLAIGLLGLVVRLLFLWVGRGDPSFLYPLVDAKTYHDLARGFAATGWTEKFLWQAAFYPAILTFVYQIFGVSVVAVKILQAVIGAFSCALTYRLGFQVGGQRVGIGAGLILVFCGPILFFEAQLLATGWAVFWTAALALLLVTCLSRPTRAGLVGLGVVLALAIYTRPTYLPVAGVVVGLLLLPGNPVKLSFARRIRGVGLVLAGLALIVGPASLFFEATTGHLGLLPPSGGINLFIGNNADYESTINIRPGLAWDNLVGEPARHGFAANPWAGSAYFSGQVRDYAQAQPGAFLARLGEKFLTVLSSREMPRNMDLYLHRQWSSLLSLLTWRLGPWGFPFGLVLPFALVGTVRSTGREFGVLKILTGVMLASLVVVFVSSRYRVPLMPLVAVLAAHGAVLTLATARHGDWRQKTGVATLLILGVLISTVPGPFPQESVDLTAELYFGVAENLYDQQDWQGTVDAMEKSLALDPEVHAAHQIMGIALAKLEDYGGAVPHFQEALRLRPGHAATIANLEQSRRDRARARFLTGRDRELSDPAGALRDLQAAAGDAPDWYKPPARQALILATTKTDALRDGKQAVSLARRAVALRGASDPYLQYVLAAALAESGEFAAAQEIARDALALAAKEGDREMATEIERLVGLLTQRRVLRR